ncbi:MAG: GntR family transcriptional regulator [Eubacterium sp.]|nr:GntR family transcriptional regulator [Eubacterium sp.]
MADTVRHGNKMQIAYDHILEKILDGTYEPGYALVERKLQDELQISRTPIRNALSRLSYEGYVVITPEKGGVVSDIQFPDLLEYYELRIAIEGLSARLAAQRRTEEQLREMERCLREHKESLAADRAMEASRDDDHFHEMIANASSNGRLAAQLDTIINQCRRASVFQNQRSTKRIEKSIAEHEKILSAIREQREDDAEHLMKEHLESVIESAKEMMLKYYYKFR